MWRSASLGLVGRQELLTLDRGEVAVHAHHRRERHLQVQVGALNLDEVAQAFVDVEHDLACIGASRRTP